MTNFARKLARKQAALDAKKKPSDMLKNLGVLPEILNQIETLQTAVSWAIEDLHAMQYTQTRQRAVMLRLFQLGPYAGPARLMEAEEIFASEYDVMAALVVLCHTHFPETA